MLDIYIEQKNKEYELIDALDFYLTYEWHIQMSIRDKSIELTNQISMFNSEKDIPELLKGIVIGYLLDKKSIFVYNEED